MLLAEELYDPGSITLRFATTSRCPASEHGCRAAGTWRQCLTQILYQGYECLELYFRYFCITSWRKINNQSLSLWKLFTVHDMDHLSLDECLNVCWKSWTDHSENLREDGKIIILKYILTHIYWEGAYKSYFSGCDPVSGLLWTGYSINGTACNDLLGEYQLLTANSFAFSQLPQRRQELVQCYLPLALVCGKNMAGWYLAVPRRW